MSKNSWIKKFCRSERFTISPRLCWLLTADPEVIRPFYFEEEEFAVAHLDTLKKQFPTLTCVPFARREDCDEVFVIVLQDPVYQRGQVIPLDIEDINHYVIGEPYHSLDAWARDVWTQLDEWRQARSRAARWVEQMFRCQGFKIARHCRWMFAAYREGCRYYFLLAEEDGARQRASMQRQIPDVNFVPFARRSKDYLLIGVVLDDPVYRRGQILIVRDHETTPAWIKHVYPTVDAWARDARRDIMQRRVLSRCGRFARLARWFLNRFSRPPPI